MSSILYSVVRLLVFINFLHTINAQTVGAALGKWSTELKASFSSFRNYMQISDLSPDKSLYPFEKYTDTAATELLNKIAKDMEDMAATRSNIVQKLRDDTEKYFKDYPDSYYLSCSNFTYHRAKAIAVNASAISKSAEKCQEFNYVKLTDNSLLYNIAVNSDKSTAHVPTNVYDGSRPILMVANWSESLDTNFKANAVKDTTLKWQYFGSSEGMLKIFPGVKWYVQIDQIGSSYPVDFFDCRSLHWYLMASACPRSVVIVVDKSGSMTGKRVIIANRTITEILLTLTENDLFNVIHINAEAPVVDAAYNLSLIQASKRNVHRVINLLNLETRGISNYTKGLLKGHELLEKTPKGYAKALFVIGDGLPYPYEKLVTNYQNYSNTRIFAYLIGKEATEVVNMRDMACKNNGFYAHIMTLSDVKENVLKYLPVIARVDNGKSLPRFSAWTGPHVREILGRSFRTTYTRFNSKTNVTETVPSQVLEPNLIFVSVSSAAYNLKPSTTKNFKQILGVLGADIPITDFEKKTRKWSLGALGYVFMINNNGYVLLHPNFRPTYNNHMKPFYQNTDLAQAEHPIDETADNGHPMYDITIRKDIMKPDPGSTSVKVYNVPDDFKSAFMVENTYFYRRLTNTPYSIAVVLPLKTSAYNSYLTKPEAKSSYVIKDFTNWLKDECPAKPPKEDGITMVSYEFCNFNQTVANEYHKSPVCALKVVINEKLETTMSCDTDYINRLRRDAHLSKDVYTKWNGSFTAWEKYGIDMGFLLFHSGLLKFYNQTIPRDPNFITKHSKKAMHDELFLTTLMYSQAYGKNDLLYFHVPSPAESQVNSSVTVTSMIYVKGANVPVAVSGLQISYEKFQSIFKTTTASETNCKSPTCLTCSDSNVACYLVTTNGYVVVSTGNDSEVGQFLATVDPLVMKSMVDNGVFTTKLVYDFQGVCNASSGITSFAPRLIDPITWFFRFIVSAVTTIGILIVQSCLTLYWALVSLAEVNPPYNVTQNPAWNSCNYARTIYSWNNTANTKKPFTVNIPKCWNCTREWTAQEIDSTNLILLHVKTSQSNCQLSCGSVAPTSTRLSVNRSILIHIDRKPPNWQCNETVTVEKGGLCAGANNLYISKILLIIGIAVCGIIMRHNG